MSLFKNAPSDRWRSLLCTATLIGGLVLPSAALTSFQIQKSPNRNPLGDTLNAVTAITDSDVWAVGFQNGNDLNQSRTLALHWDGSGWKTVPTPNPGSTPDCKGANTGNILTSVAAASTNDVWAGGFSFSCASADLNPILLHWDGQKWKTIQAGPPDINRNSALNGLTALSSDNIYAVGYQAATNGATLTLVEHWDGKNWTVMSSPNRNGNGNALNAVSANSATDIWAIGISLDQSTSSIQTLVEHFDGKRWKIVPSPNPLPKQPLNQNILSSVQAVSGNDVTAVGVLRGNQRQLTLVEHWDGKKWSVIPSPNKSEDVGSVNVLTGVTAVSANDLFAVGFFADANTSGQDETLVEHFDGKTWKIVSSPTKSLAQQLNGAFTLPGTSEVWTVGAYSVFGVQFETGFLQDPKTLVLFSGNAR